MCGRLQYRLRLARDIVPAQATLQQEPYPGSKETMQLPGGARVSSANQTQ